MVTVKSEDGIRFVLRKHDMKDVLTGEQLLEEDPLYYYALRKDFKRFFKEKEALQYYILRTGEIKRGGQTPEAYVTSVLESNVDFYSGRGFRVGCQTFDRENARKLRKWARG